MHASVPGHRAELESALTRPRARLVIIPEDGCAIYAECKTIAVVGCSGSGRNPRTSSPPGGGAGLIPVLERGRAARRSAASTRSKTFSSRRHRQRLPTAPRCGDRHAAVAAGRAVLGPERHRLAGGCPHTCSQGADGRWTAASGSCTAISGRDRRHGRKAAREARPAVTGRCRNQDYVLSDRAVGLDARPR